ncbi:hypothetical protein [Oceanobacillus kapialis]|uniref:DUF5673 domain-containing protein n=1 Tax=Oceanobacillus kapialis TaxID=481353 RepID=A0ABW5Q5S2_9BACI
MDLIITILYFSFVGYQVVRLSQTLIKLRKGIVFPVVEKDRWSIRKQVPGKPVAEPTFHGRKWLIVMYIAFILLAIAIYYGAAITNNGIILLYILFLIIPGRNLFNLFSIRDDGLLIGSRFLRWKQIKSFQFKPIDVNHRYYGHAKEVNEDGYELVIHQQLFQSHCIVVSNEAKEKVTKLLTGYGISEKEQRSAIEEKP